MQSAMLTTAQNDNQLHSMTVNSTAGQSQAYLQALSGCLEGSVIYGLEAPVTQLLCVTAVCLCHADVTLVACGCSLKRAHMVVAVQRLMQ